MKKERWAMLGSGLLLASALHCSIPDLPSDGGACPCAPGWSCDKTTGQCVHGEVASSSSSGSSGGGSTNTTTGLGGAGGSGGAGGVGACGGSMPFDMNAMNWSGYLCPDASPACDVQPNHALCCDNVQFPPAYVAPSLDASNAGQLTSTHSWFVCWLRGEAVSGNSVWYYTSLDSPPGAWGFIPGSKLLPAASGFPVTDPSGTGLPECPCP